MTLRLHMHTPRFQLARPCLHLGSYLRQPAPQNVNVDITEKGVVNFALRPAKEYGFMIDQPVVYSNSKFAW